MSHQDKQFLFGMHAYDGLGSTDEQIEARILEAVNRGRFTHAKIDADQLERKLTREELTQIINVATANGSLEDVQNATEELSKIS